MIPFLVVLGAVFCAAICIACLSWISWALFLIREPMIDDHHVNWTVRNWAALWLTIPGSLLVATTAGYLGWLLVAGAING